MNAPFFKYGAFGDEFSLIVAFITGIAFGFVLERAGFGSSRKLAAQFYFKDLSVFKVMFTAIITAMIGVYLLSVFGFLDLPLVFTTPTRLVPQIVGGLLLGLGFVIGGYCPGTSVAAVGTGKVDGMVYLVGVVLGLFGFAEIYPWIADWTHSTDLGRMTLPQQLGVPYGLVVFAVVIMAVLGFVGAEWAEKRWGGKEPGPGSLSVPAIPPVRLTPVRGFMLALLGLGLVSVFLGSPYQGSKVVVDTTELARIAAGKTDHITAEDLADRIIKGETDYILIDVRDEKEYTTYHIPGAINIPLASPKFEDLPRNETIILYSGGGTHSVQAWFLLKTRGYPAAYTLLEGLNAWMDGVLYPAKPADTSKEAQLAFAKKVEVATFFGGKARNADGSGKGVKKPALPVAPPVMSQPIPTGKKRKAREGC